MAWGVVHRVHRSGERREFYRAEADVWTLFRRILTERKRRELDPTLIVLDRAALSTEADPALRPVHDRVVALQRFFGMINLLATRLAEGMREAWTATKKQPLLAGDIGWRTEPVRLPPAPHLNEADLVQTLKSEPARGYIAAADQLAWLKRCQSDHAIDVACLRVGQTRVLHLPGELFVEYQLAAKAMRPDLHVALAAYGDYGPGYIGTTTAYTQGGYETGRSASNVAPQVEQILTAAMQKLLEATP